MKKKTRKAKPIIFIETADIFEDEFLVCAGAKKEEVIAWAKTNDLRKEFVQWITEEDEGIWKTMAQQNALFAWDNVKNSGLLLLPPLEDDWSYWETLIHETAHIVQWIARKKLLENEDEAQAYLQAYLFRKIRRTLVGVENKRHGKQ